MEIKLLDNNDEKLRIRSTEVTDFDNKEYYEKIIDSMVKECIKNHAYAAAAPQFGINKRFVLMITTVETKAKNVEELENMEINYSITPYFNPVITEMSGLQYFYEGCMSVPRTIGRVARPFKVGFDYQDINGNKMHKVVTGFEAIVCCHEFDHLDGIEFTDKAFDIIYDVDYNRRLEIRSKFPHEIVSEDMPFEQDLIKPEFRTKVYTKTFD